MKTIIKKDQLARTILDYLLFVKNDVRKALELAVEGNSYYKGFKEPSTSSTMIGGIRKGWADVIIS